MCILASLAPSKKIRESNWLMIGLYVKPVPLGPHNHHDSVCQTMWNCQSYSGPTSSYCCNPIDYGDVMTSSEQKAKNNMPSDYATISPELFPHCWNQKSELHKMQAELGLAEQSLTTRSLHQHVKAQQTNRWKDRKIGLKPRTQIGTRHFHGCS